MSLMPAYPDSKTIYRKALKNGSTLLSYSNQSSPSVVIRGYLECGSLADPSGNEGMAAMMSSMLMSGTHKHSFEALNSRLESIGASLFFGAGELRTSFSAQCLREDLDELLSTILEVLSEPAFPQEQFERYRMQMLTRLAILEQDTGYRAEQAFNEAFYRKHPYAKPLSGTVKSLQSIKIDDLKKFHAFCCKPAGMVIAVVGAITAEETSDLVEKTLGTWRNLHQVPFPELPEYSPIAKAARVHIPLEEKSQSDLIIGVLAPKTMSRDYYACTLGNNILGQFGMMGRLGNSVREKAGLAYGISSELGAGMGPVPWQISAGVNPDNLEKAIRLSLRELQRYLEKGVSERELANTRQQMIGRLPLALESNAGLASTLLSIERYGLSLDYLRELPGIYNSVSRDEITEASRRYWDLDKLVISSAGRAL